jgi:hypothetical protein
MWMGLVHLLHTGHKAVKVHFATLHLDQRVKTLRVIQGLTTDKPYRHPWLERRHFMAFRYNQLINDNLNPNPYSTHGDMNRTDVTFVEINTAFFAAMSHGRHELMMHEKEHSKCETL